MTKQNILYITVIAALAVLTCLHANAYGYTYNTGNYDLEVNNSYGNVSGQLYDYNTGRYYDVNLNPDYNGGLTGDAWDYERGRSFDVDIDRYGNVDVWEY